jgi:hypothetical protein
MNNSGGLGPFVLHERLAWEYPSQQNNRRGTAWLSRITLPLSIAAGAP